MRSRMAQILLIHSEEEKIDTWWKILLQESLINRNIIITTTTVIKYTCPFLFLESLYLSNQNVYITDFFFN